MKKIKQDRRKRAAMRKVEDFLLFAPLKRNLVAPIRAGRNWKLRVCKRGRWGCYFYNKIEQNPTFSKGKLGSTWKISSNLGKVTSSEGENLRI